LSTYCVVIFNPFFYILLFILFILHNPYAFRLMMASGYNPYVYNMYIASVPVTLFILYYYYYYRL